MCYLIFIFLFKFFFMENPNQAKIEKNCDENQKKDEQRHQNQQQNRPNVVNHTWTSVQPGPEECPEEIEGERCYE